MGDADWSGERLHLRCKVLESVASSLLLKATWDYPKNTSGPHDSGQQSSDDLALLLFPLNESIDSAIRVDQCIEQSLLINQISLCIVAVVTTAHIRGLPIDGLLPMVRGCKHGEHAFVPTAVQQSRLYRLLRLIHSTMISGGGNESWDKFQQALGSEVDLARYLQHIKLRTTRSGSSLTPPLYHDGLDSRSPISKRRRLIEPDPIATSNCDTSTFQSLIDRLCPLLKVQGGYTIENLKDHYRLELSYVATTEDADDNLGINLLSLIKRRRRSHS